MSREPQNYANHVKNVPMFHFVGIPILVILLGWTGWRLFAEPSVDSVMAFLLLFAVILAFFYARIFAAGAQDRVIRLEERMRMERLFAAPLKDRIPDFSTEQLIGLRFASDEELADLAQRVLDEGIADRKSIKKSVRNWRADHQRL